MCNVGGIDRVIRIIVGLALLSIVFFGAQMPFIGHNVVWGWIGIVPLVTGLFKFCPLYALLGLKTCSAK